MARDPDYQAGSAIQALIELELAPSTPAHVRSALGWLVARVDEEYSLPEGVDLIHEAGVVIRYVEGDPQMGSVRADD